MANEFAYGIYAVDPGGTTGVCKALVNLQQQTVRRTMTRARVKGLVKTHTLSGPFVDQVWTISRDAADWFFNCHVERALIPAGNFVFVTESFTVQQLGAELSPVQINAGLEVLLHGAYGRSWVQYQSPSEAIGFCTDRMLKSWGLWQNTPHERDAVRHAARMVDKLLAEVG